MSGEIRLQPQLDEVKEAFLKNAPDDAKKIMMNAHRNLADSGLIGRAIKKGAIAPDFTAPNAKGVAINLKSELTRGPVILKFYRGVW